jgi:hypothetical protein
MLKSGYVTTWYKFVYKIITTNCCSSWMNECNQTQLWTFFYYMDMKMIFITMINKKRDDHSLGHSRIC